MAQLLQQLVNGLSLGSVYALMAVGYSLVCSIMNFSNFAHGGVIMVGAGLGRPTLGLKGDYFCIATLGFGEALRLILDNWDFVGGARGISNIPWYTDLTTVIIVDVFAVEALYRLIRSRHGRDMIAITSKRTTWWSG